MQAKNLTAYNYNEAVIKNITKKVKSMKKSNFLITFAILSTLIISFSVIQDFYKILSSANNRSSSVTDFKLDINNLSETALVIESERNSNQSLQLNSYGSNGKIITTDEISSDLSSALINIADTDNDSHLSSEELLKLKIMRLDIDTFKRELNELHFNLKSADCNLKNYVVITEGKYAGTILYNGPLKFIDDKNIRHFGLEL